MTHPATLNATTNTRTLKLTTRGDREIVMTRDFDAPRALLFDAWTKPELIKRWLGIIRGWSMPVCEVDLRVGGTYRFVWHGPDGASMGMSGVYREIVVPERIVSTEKFDEAWYEGGAVNTLIFTEQGGRTTVTNTVLYDSKEVRDGVLKSPMEGGVAQSYNKLDELLASMTAR